MYMLNYIWTSAVSGLDNTNVAHSSREDLDTRRRGYITVPVEYTWSPDIYEQNKLYIIKLAFPFESITTKMYEYKAVNIPPW